MSNVIQITPFMHVRDFPAALTFLTDILGFRIQFQLHGYAYLELDGAGLRILHSPDAPIGQRAFAYYLDVQDVDAVYEGLKAKLDTLPPSDVFGPLDQPYNQRELLILAPDGDLIVFGSALDRPGSDTPSSA